MEDLNDKKKEFPYCPKRLLGQILHSKQGPDQIFNTGRSFCLQGREYPGWGPDREQGIQEIDYCSHLEQERLVA